MTVRRLEIDRIESFAERRSFGAAGPYEVVRGRAFIGLDPAARANQRIVDIDAPSLAGGASVESDVLTLRPVDPERGNGCLLAVVANRGQTGGVPFTLGGHDLLGASPLDAGDGWLLREGWTITWPGWQCDLPRNGQLLGCSVPEATGADGAPLPGLVRVQLQPLLFAVDDLPLSSAADFTGTLRPYPAADLDAADAVLTVVERLGGPPLAFSRDEWGFGRIEDGDVVPDPDRVWVDGGFRPDRIYEVVYRSTTCPLVGAGLAAFRDVVSHLRYDDRPGLTHTFAAGWSQSGRFLRQVLFDGFDVDERGRPVLDAVLPIVAGASRGEFNHRRAQPAEGRAPGLGNLAPFDLAGLVARTPRSTPAPKIVAVNTASEYWRADASLLHLDVDGTTDLDDSQDTRAYALAGVEHLGGADLPIPLPRGPRNHLDPIPAYRAILEIARAWVVDGVEPPASRVPRVGDGTARLRADILDQFPRIPDVGIPDEGHLPVRRQVIVDPEDAAAGLTTYPTVLGPALPALVSAVDGDGNEVAGIRLPEVQAPLATHTGWNELLTEGTTWDGVAMLTGNSHPFPTVEGTADPRPSVAARYRDRDAYLAAVRSAAERLAGERFLLDIDIDAVVATAEDRYDQLTIGA